MNKIIISMTSYPPRINCVAKAFASILMTKVDKNLYHCVLVLSKLEFPNMENDLPYDLRLIIDNGLIELIWTEDNQRSHKKLMPTLEKYPDNPILVIDDDVYRNEKWLTAFIEDHKKYPNDIIVGAFWKKYYLSGNNFIEKPCMRDTYNTNKYCEKVMIGYKPANGTGGTLYPPKTFKDKRFFDKNLYMKISPSSDETWQYCFNVIEGRTFRQLSIPHNEVFIGNSQKVSLFKENLRKYAIIYKNLEKEIPEFRFHMIKILREE